MPLPTPLSVPPPGSHCLYLSVDTIVYSLLLCVRVHHVPTPMVPVLRGGSLSVSLLAGPSDWELDTPGFASPSTTSTCVTSPGKETRGSGLCDCQGLTAHVYKTLSHGLPTSSELGLRKPFPPPTPQGPSPSLLWPVLPSAGVAMFTSVALTLCT